MRDLVYLIEDDKDIANLITRTLSQQGIEVMAFRRLADFMRELGRRTPDLCLIDLSLPDGDGLSVINSNVLPATVPKIIVTGRGNLTDRVVGLEIGADDYVVKPFEPRELASRVKAVLRRSRITGNSTTEEIARELHFGEWTADLEGCTLVHSDGEHVQLSATEAILLGVLAQSPGRVLSRSQLLDATTSRGGDPFDRSIDARISRLRKKLRDDPFSPQIIRTVYGAGYVFAPLPKKSPQPSP